VKSKVHSSKEYVTRVKTNLLLEKANFVSKQLKDKKLFFISFLCFGL